MTAKVKESEAVTGAVLVADSGFTCIKPGTELTVKYDRESGFYVDCEEGQHFLDGQRDGHGHIIGFTLKEGK